MSLSNYPNGFKDTVTIRNMPVVMTQPGQVFFVNSTSVLAQDGVVGTAQPYPTGGTYQRPFATIDYAIGQCTASRGDVILAMPGHTETVSAAGSISCDVAGVAIIGLGAGSLRPTISFTTAAAAAITVSAADVTWKNVILSAGFADVSEAFTVTATGFTLEDAEAVDVAAAKNFVDIIDTNTSNNSADDLTVINLKWITPDTSSGSVVNVDADLDGLTILDCYTNLGVNGVLSSLAEVAAGKDLTNINVQRNYCTRLVTGSAVQLITFADTTTTNTGLCADNFCRSLDTAGELIITAGTNITFMNNKTTSAIDKSGYLLPGVDS